MEQSPCRAPLLIRSDRHRGLCGQLCSNARQSRSCQADVTPMPMQMMTVEPELAGEGAAYTYRPSVMGAGWTFKLTGEGIVWTAGARHGLVPFDKVRRLRMSYVPISMQSHRFVTELWSADGTKLRIVSTSWRSMAEQVRQDAP